MSCTFWRMRKKQAAKRREQEIKAVEVAEEVAEAAEEAKPKRKKVTKNDSGADSEA